MLLKLSSQVEYLFKKTANCSSVMLLMYNGGNMRRNAVLFV